MQTLAPTNDCRSNSATSEENLFSEHKLKTNESSGFDIVCEEIGSSSAPADDPTIEEESSKEKDTATLIQFISEMLMDDEDLGNKPSMLHECLALQATEKSLYDALVNNLDKRSSDLIGDFDSLGHDSEPRDKTSYDYSEIVSDHSPNSSGVKKTRSRENGSSHSPSPSPADDLSIEGESSKEKDTATLIQFISEKLMDEDLGNIMLHDCLALQATEKSLYDALANNLDNISSDLMGDFDSLGHDSEPRDKTTYDYSEMVSDHSPHGSGVRKTRCREDSDLTECHRINKQLANNTDESEPLEMYDDVLICSNLDCPVQTCSETERCKAKQRPQQNEQSKGGPNRREKKKNTTIKKSVDIRSLLMQCAQAASNFDNKTLSDLLSEIRKHSSPTGDGMERVAHYFANALEARLAGTGIEIYTALNSNRRSTIEILKAYKLFITVCPFRHMSNTLANRTIAFLASKATTLHVIDFGILYGFQWPCLIHVLSLRPGGPPKLRITAIDFPQPGFRPAERVEDTCRRLAKYGERFGVPFEYNAIAQKWDNITLEDLKIEKNELLVVNCMYRLHNVPDETETGDSPRDAVLNLIKRINPDMFIHGVVSSQYNTPFFVTRFREAFYHFSTMFDMFEATMPQDDGDRLLYEQQFFGIEAMNVIACEGTERIERPETYRQWQARTLRAGFRQLSLDQETVKRVSKVKKDYHKNFSMDEDGKWILLEWKGHVIHGFSCWRPTHN